MRRHCHNCKTFLRVWETRCPCCRTSAMRWLHFFAVVAFSLTVVFYLLVIVR
jgi:RNA polymerase subunit RPABC4/transcription elongation factor Spt4